MYDSCAVYGDDGVHDVTEPLTTSDRLTQGAVCRYVVKQILVTRNNNNNNNNNNNIMLAGTHIFQPLAFESHDPQNASAISFVKKLGHKISQRSGDTRETQFLFNGSV